MPGVLDQVLQVNSPMGEGEEIPGGLGNLATFLQYIGFLQLSMHSLMDQISIPIMGEH